MSYPVRVVWIARHGHRADAIEDNLFVGNSADSDPELSETGWKQSEILALFLAKQGINHLLSSPFRRTLQTASSIAHHTNLKVKIEPGISEFLSKDWYQSQPKFNTSPPELKIRRIDSEYHGLVTPLYPELWEIFLARCQQCYSYLLDRLNGDLAIVTHGSCLIAIAAAIIEEKTTIQTDYCALLKVSYGNETTTLENFIVEC